MTDTTPRAKPRGFRQFLLAFDSETTGLAFNELDPSFNSKTGERYQMVSFGALVVDTVTLKVVDQLYVEIKWNGTSVWSPGAERVHGLSKEYLDEHGVEEEEAACMIAEFILKYWGNTAVNMLGHNVSTFDLQFLRALLYKFGITVPFGNKHVDTNSIGFAVFQTHNSDDLFSICGVKQRAEHNSLDDAMACIKVLTTVRSLIDRCMTM